MKKIIISTIAVSSLFFTVTSCKTDFDNDVKDIPVTKGDADFSRYVSLGNSLTSGFRDNALYIDGQNESYPSMIAAQMRLAGGGDFKQPLMNDNLGGIPSANISNKKVLVVAGGALAPVDAPGVGTTTLANIYNAGPYQNMGVPGAKVAHLLAPNYGDPAGLNPAAPTANPYFVRFASSKTTSVVADALAQNPTFVSLWIGNNDVLGYATTGGDGTNPITPVDGPIGVGFTSTYNALVGSLFPSGTTRKGIVANIPDVTSIPFFTRVPYNPIPPEKFNTAPAGSASNQNANIDALNAQVFGPLKQVLTALGQGNRLQLLSKTAGNPVLLKDESLANLGVQITAALVGAGVPAPQAGLMGQLFGQARHSTSQDLIPLTTSTVLGTTPASPFAVAPFDKYGTTYPLEDKHVLRGKFNNVNGEVEEVLAATVSFNAAIKAAATAKDLAFVDMNTKMKELDSKAGIVWDGVKYSATFVTGGAFSLDGVHLTGRGYGIVANEFIKTINAKYRSTLPQVDPNKYSGVTFP
ncbi:G-D-S-L family lipolytic protein [Chryseobacterium phosphatilyticum]|uniref:G-D-S-L family lipolytic protein n=1 Tax=Chryseobacterium phosphatilyticum TaxID=475075 RepID=A0A316XCH4_9FLAO|nr:G-D-S-L family lipolytic protein [Chryseobacterium phosphatilyticum]PWN68490.1 G-D-S-L family lipolytic protein [Chryseobacterium phosphatilyticum]